MSIQGQFNQALGAVAAGAAMIKGESAKKVALAAEDAELAEKEFNLKNEKEAAEKSVSEAQANLEKVLPEASGMYRNEKGQFMNKKEGKEREVQSAKELEKRQEALSVLMKKIYAVNIQRADWKRRMGGIR